MRGCTIERRIGWSEGSKLGVCDQKCTFSHRPEQPFLLRILLAIALALLYWLWATVVPWYLEVA